MSVAASQVVMIFLLIFAIQRFFVQTRRLQLT